MTIVFHCEHCEKKISAPDEFGGKAGKCPHCHQRVFIPSPPDQLEEIPLAPEDPQDEKRRQELLREQIRLQEQLNQHKEAPPEPTGGSTSPLRGGVLGLSDSDSDSEGTPAAGGRSGKADVSALVGQYLVLMSKGNLDAAEQRADQIAASGPSAKHVVEQMAMQDILEPALANVPPSVISGYFKKLLARFGK
jgi:DNA-directed RNA polymerase subunit RPC12/RpoP